LKKLFLLFLFLAACQLNGITQTFYQLKGVPAIQEGGTTVIASPDGNMLVGGYKGDSAMVMKVTPNGNILWTRTFAPSSALQNKIWHLNITPDGYLIGTGGFLISTATPGSGFYFKMDINGNLIWINREAHSVEVFFTKIIPVSALEYRVFVNYRYLNGAWGDMGSILVDASTGNINTTTPRFNLAPVPYVDDLLGANIFPGQGVFYSGRTYLNGAPISGSRPILAKFDAANNPVWAKYYFHTSGTSARLYGKEVTQQGNKFICSYFGDYNGISGNFTFGLFATDLNGNMLWNRNFDLPISTTDDFYRDVAIPGGYVMIGSSISAGNRDMFLVAADTLGNLQWARRMGSPGSSEFNYYHSYPGTYALGSLWVTGTSTTAGNEDLFLARIDPAGSISCFGLQPLVVNTTTFPLFTANLPITTAPEVLPTSVVPSTLTTNLVDVCQSFSISLGPDQSSCNPVLLSPGSGAGWQFVWQDGSTGSTFSATVPGTYHVTVTSNCCVASDTVIVSLNSPPPVNLGPDQNLCAGATGLLDAGNPGATYLWSNNFTGQSQTVGAGTWWVQVTLNGCVGVDTIVITTTALSVNLGPDQNLCAGSTTLLDAGNPGATYLWSNNFTGQSQAVGPGTWWVQVTLNGCVGVDTIVITTTVLPVNLGPDQGLCVGSTTLLDAGNPGATYLWSNNFTGQSQTVGAGTWWVQVTLNGCVGADTIVITTTALSVNLGPDQSLCPGSTALLDAGNPGATYLWSNNFTGQSQAVGAGTWWVQVTLNGCVVADTIVISINPLSVNLGADQNLCAGSTLLLDAGNPGATYLWSNNFTGQSQTVGTGTWWVQVTLNGCVASDTIVITITSFSANLGADQNLCAGSTVLLDAGNLGATYFWSNNFTGQSQTVGAGIWWVQVTVNGCIEADTVVIGSFPQPLVELGPPQTICEGQTVLLYAGNPGAAFLWNNSETTQSQSVSASGVWSVTVTNSDGCSTTDQVLITVIQSGILDLGPDIDHCGSAVSLRSNLDAQSYLWSTGETVSAIEADITGDYILTVVNECGIDSDTVHVEISGIISGPFFPNAFTPNHDFLNDLFCITGIFPAEGYNLQVWNQWGSLIYETNDPAGCWDGNYLGDPAQEGVYVFVLRMLNCEGQLSHIAKSVTLIR
jgi:gliding motility-associated-like protein